MSILTLIIAFAVGLIIPFQGVINSRLSQAMGHPYGAALVNFCGGLIIFIVACILTPAGFPRPKVFLNVPPYLFLGGVVGSFFIIGAIFLLPKIGATTWIALIVTGQLIMSIVMDHFGLLGLNMTKINLSRVIGAAMLLGGVFLIQKK